MAFCAKCGASLADGASFCAACGRPAGAGAAAPGPSAAETTGMSSNVAGALAYILGLITGIIFLVIDPYKNDRFVRFHAFQSIFFNVAWIAILIVFSILGSILSFATAGFGGLIMLPLWGLLSLVFLAFWIFLMYKAYNNEQYRAPFIGDLAAKQAGA